MRKVLIDAHTHTVASGHAYSSLQEMAKAAVDMGLEVLGITEHGPSVPGTCPTLYFKNMFTVPRQMYGIRLLMGCEINILDTKGSLDLTDEQIGWLDLAIAGIHAAWYQGGTKEENTEGMIRVIKKVIPEAPHECLLILDANTGQNGIDQAMVFKEAVPLTGIIITKMDGTSKGGILLSIRDRLSLPVKFIGLGEKMDDLEEFDLDKYLYGLLVGDEEEEKA